MKQLIPSLLTVGVCVSMILTTPLTVNGEQTTKKFETAIGVGVLLNPTLSNDEKEELMELAVRMLFENKRRNYSLDNARERMDITENGEIEPEVIPEEEPKYENRWGVSELTDREKELLADIVWLEAGNQGLVGQELIVVTILNRVMSDQYDDEVIEVISADGQFSTWPRVNEAAPTDETYEAIENVLSGNAEDYVENAQFKYFNNEPSFGNDYTKVGAHYFYN